LAFGTPLEARALRVAPRDDGFFYLTGALKQLVIGTAIACRATPHFGFSWSRQPQKS